MTRKSVQLNRETFLECDYIFQWRRDRFFRWRGSDLLRTVPDDAEPILFETFPVKNGRALFVEKHLERMRRGNEAIGNRDFIFPRDISARLKLVLERVPSGFYRARLVFFPQLNSLYFTLTVEEQPTVRRGGLVVMLTRVKSPYASGLGMNVKDWRIHGRIFREVLRDARRSGFDEAVFCDSRGNLLEGTRSSLFVVAAGIVYYPEKDVLSGITREVIISLMKKEGIPCRPGVISPSLALTADAAFLTGSVSGIQSVLKISGLRVFDPGHPLVRRTRKAYEKETENTY